MNGKGSKPRPLSVPRKKFESNWDKIFKSKMEDIDGIHSCGYHCDKPKCIKAQRDYLAALLNDQFRIIKEAKAEEREACAKVCEEIEKRKWLIVKNGGQLTDVGAMACRDAIRARNEVK